MEPIDYLVAMWRSRWVIALLTVLGLGAGLLVATNTTPTYQARSSVLLTPSPGVANNELGEVGNYMNYQIHSYAELVNSRVVLDPVLDDVSLPYGVDWLENQVNAQVPVNTSIIDISVDDTDPARAARLANSVARHLETAVEAAAPEPSDDASTLELQTVAQATRPQNPIAPRTALYLAGGAGLGFFLAVLLGLARFALVRSRQTSEPSSPGRRAAAGTTSGTSAGTSSGEQVHTVSDRELEGVRS
ncbi:YveK family protein [Kocuria sp. M1N1S27]|uniref:YveK family protein n=1 Tax=Kocuria kalidii TaxID=3376283 RepID=UPI00378FB42D